MKKLGIGLCVVGIIICIVGSLIAILFIPLKFLGTSQGWDYIYGDAGLGKKNYEFIDANVLMLELILINIIGIALFFIGFFTKRSKGGEREKEVEEGKKIEKLFTKKLRKFFGRTENLCAIALIIIFFIPCGGIELGPHCFEAGLLPYEASWLIPILCIVTIILTQKDSNHKKPVGVITGLLAIGFNNIYSIIIEGYIFRFFDIRVYLALLGGIAMILSAVGVLKIPKKDNI